MVFDVNTAPFLCQVDKLRSALRYLQAGISKIAQITYCVGFNEPISYRGTRFQTKPPFPRQQFDLCVTDLVHKDKTIMEWATDLIEKDMSFIWVGPHHKTEHRVPNFFDQRLKFLFGVADSGDIKTINQNLNFSRDM